MERTKTTITLDSEQFDQIFSQKIEQFNEYINRITLRDAEVPSEARRRHVAENLRFDEFCQAMKEIFGNEISSQSLKTVFKKLSANPECVLDWGEVFDFGATDDLTVEHAAMTEQYGDIFATSMKMVIGEACGHQKRRDVVQSIRFIPSVDGFVTLSQKGALCIWSSKFDLQATVELTQSSWTTGIDYLSVLRRTIVSCERSFCVWDSRGKAGQTTPQIFTVEPLPYYPTCVCWVPLSTDSHEDTVLFGDEMGNLTLLTLTVKDISPKQSRENKKFVESNSLDPKLLSVPMLTRAVHKQAVVSVKYLPTLKCFASCSQDADSAFVLEPIEKFRDDHAEIRTVNITKGVNAFQYCINTNVVATGGNDKVIRIWHPHLWSRPAGKMAGHLFCVVALSCNEADGWLISLCAARTFRVWDIQSYACLQVFADADLHPGERRIHSMLYDANTECLITGSSIVQVWPLTRAAIDTMQMPRTHERSLVQIIFNVPQNQLASVCTDTLKVWDVESGHIVYQLNDLHESAEVSAIAVDRGGFRLASGASDGSIKVLDWATGQVLKWRSARSLTQHPDSDIFESETELSIVSMQFMEIDDCNRMLLVLGWANRLRVFLDHTDETSELQFLGEMSDSLSVQPQPGSRVDTAKGSVNSATRRHRSNTNTSLRSRKSEQILATYKLTTLEKSSREGDTDLVSKKVVTGVKNGNLVFWDVDTLTADKIGHLPPSEDDDVEQRGVLCLYVLKYSPPKVYPDKEKEKGAVDPLFGAATLAEAPKTSREGTTAQHGAITKGSSAENMSNKPPQTTDHSRMPTIVMPSENAPIGNAKERTNAGHRETTASTMQSKGAAPKVVYHSVPITYFVTGHEDGCMRFWDEAGRLIKTITIPTRIRGTPIVQLCGDSQLRYLVVADAKGFVSMWEIDELWIDKKKTASRGTAKIASAELAKQSEIPEELNIYQIVTWRAHTQRIVSVVYADSQNAIYTASIDHSVRIWWGVQGTYVGYFGQFRALKYPLHEREPGIPSHLPCDITETAIVTKREGESDAAQQQKAAQKLSDYRLIFDENRWQDPTPRPLPNINLETPQRKKGGKESRAKHQKNKKQAEAEKAVMDKQKSSISTGIPAARESPKKSVPAEPLAVTDRRYFGALCKPKPYNTHLESGPTADTKTGAVYRALPVYRVQSPEAVRYPTGLMRKLQAASQGFFEQK